LQERLKVLQKPIEPWEKDAQKRIGYTKQSLDNRKAELESAHEDLAQAKTRHRIWKKMLSAEIEKSERISERLRQVRVYGKHYELLRRLAKGGPLATQRVVAMVQDGEIDLEAVGDVK
jgi:ABC-type Mn2+/Zn2+ transport system ATPase subunit